MATKLRELSDEQRKAIINSALDELEVPESVLSNPSFNPGGAASWGIINGGGCGKSLEDFGELAKTVERVKR